MAKPAKWRIISHKWNLVKGEIAGDKYTYLNTILVWKDLLLLFQESIGEILPNLKNHPLAMNFLNSINDATDDEKKAIKRIIEDAIIDLPDWVKGA